MLACRSAEAILVTVRLAASEQSNGRLNELVHGRASGEGEKSSREGVRIEGIVERREGVRTPMGEAIWAGSRRTPRRCRRASDDSEFAMRTDV